MTNDKLLLTVNEAAAILRVSRAFVYELVARGDLPALHLGRRILIPRETIDRLVDNALTPS
jgi:excisionase family DNA binding protein